MIEVYWKGCRTAEVMMTSSPIGFVCYRVIERIGPLLSIIEPTKDRWSEAHILSYKYFSNSVTQSRALRVGNGAEAQPTTEYEYSHWQEYGKCQCISTTLNNELSICDSK